VITALRERVETLGDDRYLAPDLEKAAGLIASNAVAAATQIQMPELHP